MTHHAVVCSDFPNVMFQMKRFEELHPSLEMTIHKAFREIVTTHDTYHFVFPDMGKSVLGYQFDSMIIPAGTIRDFKFEEIVFSRVRLHP